MNSREANERLSYWPFWPKPWPWPPVTGPLLTPLSDEETSRLFGRLIQGAGDSGLRGTLRIFPAIAAGLALGAACGLIYNKYLRSGELPAEQDDLGNRIDFITQFVCKATLNAAQIAACTRPDYVNAIEALSPSIEKQLANSEIIEKINDLALKSGGTERILPAVVFGACVVIGFLSQANLR